MMILAVFKQLFTFSLCLNSFSFLVVFKQLFIESCLNDNLSYV